MIPLYRWAPTACCRQASRAGCAAVLSVPEERHPYGMEQQFSAEWFEPNTWTVTGSYGYDAVHDYNVEVSIFLCGKTSEDL